MTLIISSAQSLSNAIRAHRYPVLEAGNLSYPDGQYTVEFIPGSDRASFTLKHQIENAPLIVRLLKQKHAKYVCTVSSPISAYRRTHVSDEAAHEIRWDREDLGEPPLFTPMILCTTSRKLDLSQSRDGVHRLWHGARISLQQGSRLALGHVVQLRSSIFNLLSFSKREDLKDGTFFVDADTEPFQFRVNLSPELHKFLQFAGSGQTREHIITHIVTACFALLQRDFATDNEEEGGWQTHRNLLALAELLENRGLPHWSDSENFHPEEIATALYPHILPREDDGDED